MEPLTTFNPDLKFVTVRVRRISGMYVARVDRTDVFSERSESIADAIRSLGQALVARFGVICLQMEPLFMPAYGLPWEWFFAMKRQPRTPRKLNSRATEVTP